MELVLVSPFIDRKGTHTAAVRALSLVGSSLTSRKIPPEGGYPPSGNRVLPPGDRDRECYLFINLTVQSSYETQRYMSSIICLVIIMIQKSIVIRDEWLTKETMADV